MACKKIYSCNTCGEEYRDFKQATDDLFGLNFSGMRKFTLSSIHSTDGYHICIWCLGQIAQQAPPLLEGKIILTIEESKKEMSDG